MEVDRARGEGRGRWWRRRGRETEGGFSVKGNGTPLGRKEGNRGQGREINV